MIRASENLLPRQLTGAWIQKNETLWESKLQEYENRIINSARDNNQDERNDNGRDNNDEEEDDDTIFS